MHYEAADELWSQTFIDLILSNWLVEHQMSRQEVLSQLKANQLLNDSQTSSVDEEFKECLQFLFDFYLIAAYLMLY